MNDDSISKLLAMSLSLGITSVAYDDYYFFSDEKLMNYSVSLVMEIDELLDNGYTKDDIYKIIMGCDFCRNDPELTKEEGEYLRSYSIRMLDIRYNLYVEEKNAVKSLKKELYKKSK